MPASREMIQKFGDKYRKIRNTLRYLLSNLYDFDPRVDRVDRSDSVMLCGGAICRIVIDPAGIA